MLQKRHVRNLAAIADTALALSVSLPVFAYSASECSARAERVARGGPTVVGSSARGAAGGALFGAVVGGKKSARKGAAAGAVVGGASSAIRNNETYKRVYDDCMYGRY